MNRGFFYDSFNQNLVISEGEQGMFNYNIVDNTTFTKNKFSMHLLEVPFEFRWRTSTPDSYKFWRIYTGIKLGYVFTTTSKFNSSMQDIELKNINDFEKVQYALTLSVGYSTWNAYLYYALNPIIKNEAKVDGESLDINAIKIGLIFYIL